MINLANLFKEKLYADKEDFMREFNCGRDKALGLIRAIKKISDIAEISGQVTTTDVELWLSLPLNKIKREQKGGVM